jgi:hypothetical protein
MYIFISSLILMSVNAHYFLMKNNSITCQYMLLFLGDRVKKVWASLRDTRTRYIRADKTLLRSGASNKKGKMDSWRWSKALEFLNTADYLNNKYVAVFF